MKIATHGLLAICAALLLLLSLTGPVYGATSPFLSVSPTIAPVGAKLTITGTGLSPNANLVLEWSTANATWNVGIPGAYTPTAVPEVRGIDTFPWEEVLANVVTNSTGSFSQTVPAPVDNNGAHVIAVIAAGSKTPAAQATFTLLPSFHFSPSSGPVGTPVTVYATGLGARLYASAYHVLFDNNEIGYMTGISTRGEGNFTFYVTGAVGMHTISVYNGYPGPAYLNSNQAPASVSITSYAPPYIPFHGQFNITASPPLNASNFTPQATVIRPQVILPQVTANSGERMTVTPNVAPVGAVVNVTGLGFPPNTLTSLRWATHVGSHVVGFISTTKSLRNVTTNAAGSFSFIMNVPYDLGGLHNITAPGVAPNGNATLYIERSASISATQGPEGSMVNVTLTGLGWTYQDNIAAVDYDNSYMGYVCGFNTNGNITLHLVVTGAPGYHTIDLYPSNYLGPTLPNDSSIAIFREPILTPYDGPSQVPEFHFSFLITGATPQTVSTTTTTSTATSTTTSTATIITTVPGPTSTATIITTVPGPTSTTTSTTTATTTSVRAAAQTAPTVPGWAYALMGVFLVAGLAVGYAVRRRPGPTAKQPPSSPGSQMAQGG